MQENVVKNFDETKVNELKRDCIEIFDNLFDLYKSFYVDYIMLLDSEGLALRNRNLGLSGLDFSNYALQAMNSHLEKYKGCIDNLDEFLNNF